MSTEQTDDTIALYGYQTEIDGREARGVAPRYETTTEWLETTEPAMLEDWR